MIYKIVGDTSNGTCYCGHRTKRGEEYYIFPRGTSLDTVCKKCAKDPKSFNTIRVPEDLVNVGEHKCCIPLK